MPGPLFEPIRPKGRVMPNVSIMKLAPLLVRFAVGVIGRQTKYPPQRTPPSGRKPRRRTGEYGRRWTMKGPSPLKLGLAIEVGSNLSYAPYVGGLKTKKPRQAKATATIGWTSVEEVGQDEWDKIRPAVIKALHG